MKITLNIVRIFTLVVCSMLLNNGLNAQILTIDISNPGQGPSAGMVRVTNVGAVGDKKATGLTYEDVEGTPFWDENWNSAILYFKSGAIYKLPKAKLNLYTSEVHYTNDKDGELVAETNLIDKIIFLNSKDSSKISAVFAVLPDYIDNKPTGFFRVFNNGAYQLILLQKNLVKVSPYDPLLQKSTTSFFKKTYYGIYNNGKTIPLKSLDKNSIVSVLPFNASVEPWVKNTKNKFKSEEDMIALLNYYNSIELAKIP
jgi:hypothetical protein